MAGPATLLAIAAMIPILLFAAVSALRGLERERTALREQAVADARRVSEAVDQELAADIDDARSLAIRPSLDGAMDLKAFAEVARREQTLHPLWRTVLVLDTRGRRLINQARPGQLGPAVEPASLQRVIETGQPLIGSIAKGQGYAVPIRAPVIRDGKVKAVVTIVVSPAGMRGVIARARVPSTWITSVVDSTGLVVARTHNEAQFIGRPASQRALAAREQTASGVYDGYTLEGVQTVSAFWRSPTTGWSAHIGVPKSQFEAPLRRSIAFTILGSLLSLALTGAFAALLLRETRRRRVETLAFERGQRMEALGRLTGGVAHDFNNLLMIIQGNAEILGRRLSDPRAASALDAIAQATQRATRLTRELLTFARGGSSAQAEVDINETIASFVGSLGQAVGPDVEVRTLLEPGLPKLRLDRVQLELALLNLGVNARDAMPGGGILTLSTRRPAPAVIELTVADTGTGIDPRHLATIFDPFFTTKPVGAGTGLGLTQVYGVVRQAGGTIDAHNRQGKGAVFVLRFPVEASGDTAKPAAATPTQAPSPGRKPVRARVRKGARVLLVDDNEAVRAVTATYLRERGYAVTEAGDVDAASAALDQAKPTAVVSDIVMPGARDGIAFAAEVMRRFPDVPVVLVSGYSASADDARGRGLTVLQKPYALDDLAALLEGGAAPADAAG